MTILKRTLSLWTLKRALSLWGPWTISCCASYSLFSYFLLLHPLLFIELLLNYYFYQPIVGVSATGFWIKESGFWKWLVFRIFQGSVYTWVTRNFEWHGQSQILTGFWICLRFRTLQVSEYTRVYTICYCIRHTQNPEIYRALLIVAY